MTSPLHVIDWLQGQPDLVVLPVVLIVVTVVIGVAPLVGRYVLQLPPSDARDAAAFDALKVIVAMSGALYAFTLVQAVSNLRAAEAVVAREAAAIATIDRALLRYGPQAAAMRPAVVAYGTARITQEWPALTQGGRDEDTDRRYNDLSRTVRSLEPADTRQQATYAELLRALDDLAEQREMTLENGDSDLPDLFWIAAFGQLAFALGVATLTRVSLVRIASVMAMSAALSLLLALLVIIDHPYGPGTGVKPTAIAKILAVNARRI